MDMIFYQVGTNKKAILFAYNGEENKIIDFLNKKCGGEWKFEKGLDRREALIYEDNEAYTLSYFDKKS